MARRDAKRMKLLLWFFNLPDYLKGIWFLGCTGFLILMVAAIAYILRFGWIPMEDREWWGQFGDFLGGTTNPILAFLTFVGVLWTIGLNNEELKRSLELSERQKISEQKETIHRIIERIYLELKEILNTQVESGYGQGLPPTVTLQASIENSITNHINWEFIRKNNFPIFLTIHDLLTQLKFYLTSYDTLSGDALLSSYYRRYFVVLALHLNHFKIVPDELLQYYQDFTVNS